MPNTVILRGDQFTLREDRSNQALTPGMLIEFSGSATKTRVQKHSTGDGKAAAMFALEADYVGTGVTTAYISGDRIPYADCAPGVIVWAHLASGSNVNRGDFLSSDGSGALHAYAGTAPPICQADEAADASTGITATGTLRFRARVV